MSIKDNVSALVRKHQSRNPFEIIRGMNVILIYAPLVDVRGFYQYFQRNNIIYIDENLTEQEKIFVCAHELGHMLLHKNSNAIYMDTKTHFNTNKYELEADLFAMELLLPDSKLNEYKDYTLSDLSSITGLPETLIEIRIR